MTTVSAWHPPVQGQWTIAGLEVLPDDGVRREILDGVLYVSPSLSRNH